MENNYCFECGNKLSPDTVFCPECGTKVKENEKQIKFCSQCGEQMDAKAETCPKCGVRLMNPLTNSAGKALNEGIAKTDSFITRYVTARNVIIVFLIIVIIGMIMVVPGIIEEMTPYKEVGQSYIAHPVAGENVQFDAEYVGTTSGSEGSFNYSGISNNDIVRVGDEYVIIQGDYLTHDLYGNEGRTVHLEGRFAEGGKSHQPTDDGYINGYWFGADSIELV